MIVNHSMSSLISFFSNSRQLPIWIGGKSMSSSDGCTMTNVDIPNACPPFGYINHSICNETVDVFLTCRCKINIAYVGVYQ